MQGPLEVGPWGRGGRAKWGEGPARRAEIPPENRPPKTKWSQGGGGCPPYVGDPVRSKWVPRTLTPKKSWPALHGTRRCRRSNGRRTSAGANCAAPPHSLPHSPRVLRTVFLCANYTPPGGIVKGPNCLRLSLVLECTC